MPRLVRLVLGVQAVYYVATGVWPVIDMDSFEAITGPKVDDWLVKMVGLLVTTIGISLAMARRARRWTAEVRALAILSALSFIAIDVTYALSGRISPIYLADAVAEAAIAGLLGMSIARAGGVKT
jgi:energy-converting hydrogenase Eha subunit E